MCMQPHTPRRPAISSVSASERETFGRGDHTHTHAGSMLYTRRHLHVGNVTTVGTLSMDTAGVDDDAVGRKGRPTPRTGVI